ncbi:hypothetical protein [Sandarakinorhabdus oryzae]|uniref:hypothetical protein n=1 Tax=Sandarakinorhabdus oryzae TaxID=2675220 RepID=UPI0012E1F708|nr:hypothetical protein [Sandarakinorhabdus oryzae]
MAKNNDPLIESLMQMAVAAAPLIRKARESGIFRDRDDGVVDAEIVTPKAPEAPTPPEPAKAPDATSAAPAAPSPDTGALQDIIVRQALRINELEAELAALKATAAPKAKAKPKAKPKAKARARTATPG